jgi:hypothetical protein
MKSTIQKTAIGLLTLSLTAFLLQSYVQAQDKAPDKKPAAESSEKGEARKARTLPFHGTLTAVDKEAKTLTVGKRVFKITPETKIYSGSEKTPAALHAAVVGERITGSYQQTPDGKLTARSIYFGKTEAAAGKKAKGEKQGQ